MLNSVGRPYLIMLLIAILLGGGTLTARYSGYFKLQQVQIQPERYDTGDEALNLSKGKNLFAAPLGEVADRMLKKKKIFMVEINYQLPDGITIDVNDVRPRAIVIDRKSRNKYYLTADCHLLPIKNEIEQIDFPLITGPANCTVYGTIKDDRISLIVGQLERLKKDCIDFYLAISNIDMSQNDGVTITIDGVPFTIETYAGDLYRTVRTLKTFLLEYNPDLHDVTGLDMRLEGMIIATG